jgi:radical SAM protein with 4Fe4S-binding SPASM domain
MKKSIKKAMTLTQFKMLTKMAKRDGIVCLALIGGEPTIHPQFIPIMKHAVKNFFFIYLDTNGIFPRKVRDYLLTNNPHQLNTININIATPGFILNPKIRTQVLNLIETLAPRFNVSLVITNTFLDWKIPKQIIDYVNPSLLRKVTVAFGMEGCIIGNNNYTTIENFGKIGANLYKMLKYLEVKKVRRIVLRRLTLPCMFTTGQWDYLKAKKYINPVDYTCHPISEKRDIFINPAMETFSCYLLSAMKKKLITIQTNLAKLAKHYQQNALRLRQQFVLPYCQKCPFYGFGPGKCSGSCPAFTLNALRPKQFFSKQVII